MNEREVVEVCPHCESENEFEMTDDQIIQAKGKVFCQTCWDVMLLCSECLMAQCEKQPDCFQFRPIEEEIMSISTQERIYIAGPMTGYEQHNYPAFWEAETHLRSLGYHNLWNPCDMDPSLSYVALIRLGLEKLMECDAIYLLDGWERSQGAKLEQLYAVTTGMMISYPEDRKVESNE